MIGLSENSTEKEKITVEDGVVKTYKVIETGYKLSDLQEELDMLNTIEKPTEEELLEHAKAGIMHPYYDPNIIARKEELTTILEKYNGDSI